MTMPTTPVFSELFFEPLVLWLKQQLSFTLFKVPQTRQKCNLFALLFEFHCPRYSCSVFQYNQYWAPPKPWVRTAHYNDPAFFKSFTYVMIDNEVYWTRFYSPLHFRPCETCLNIQRAPLLENLVLDAERERLLDIAIDNLVAELVEEGWSHSRHRHIHFESDPFQRYPYSPPRSRPHTDPLLKAPTNSKDFFGKSRFRTSAMETKMGNMF